MSEKKQTYQELKRELDHILAELQHEDTDIDTAVELHKKGQQVLKKLDTYLQKVADGSGLDITVKKGSNSVLGIYIFAIVVTLFSFVLLFGAPYVPTFRRQSETALDLLDLKPGQTVYELGCGDGRVLKAAAARGLNAVGYELNPLLAFIAYCNTWKYRRQVRVRWGNFWRADLSRADGIFVFLLDRYMPKLDEKIRNTQRPMRLASFAFKIPDKKPIATEHGIFLYEYK